jgi:hypothetical protein
MEENRRYQPRLTKRMSTHTGHIWAFIVVIVAAQTALTQTRELHGQASGWLSTNPGSSSTVLAGVRYVPDLLVKDNLGGGLGGEIDLSLNMYGTILAVTNEHPAYDRNAKLYRAWFRLSTDRFEARVGLQKINFGTALLFRPLMWFDRIDPRDPLQLTDGVYGILTRYYFQHNANFWLWALYGNNNTKGWETVPTERKTSEYGGRAQSPLWTGEIGLTYHHRRADLSSLIFAQVQRGSEIAPEDRLGLDGKWDIGIGVWFEAVLLHQTSDLVPLTYQRQGTIGADYTFAVGNGLYVATEYFRSDNSSETFNSGEGAGFSGLTLNYPVGIVDQVSAIFYRDWKDEQWYRLLNWQRTYDNWSFYLLGFWNPENIQIYRSQAGTNPFAGSGFQLMVVFNH